MLEGQILYSDFFKKFTSDSIWKDTKAEFNYLLGDPIWVNVEKLNKNTENLLQDSLKLKESCIKKLLELLRKSKRSGKAERTSCCEKGEVMSLPIFIEGKNYGYLGLIHFKKGTLSSVINLLSQFVDIVAKKSQRELELERLYETIGPRSLALSTIHTLHRIMSSNLNLDELLPRIARLSLQILDATTCKIYLFDKKKNILLPKVVINLKKINYRRKIRQNEERLANKIARSATPILKDNLIAVPLIEEEVLGVILVSQKASGKPFTYFDQDILSTLAEQAVVAIKNARLFEQQERLTLGSIKSISSLLKVKEGTLHSHTPAFKSMLSSIANELKISREENIALQNAALLHDIEKVNIPDKILTKSKPLTSREYKIIKENPFKTIRILKPLQSLEPAIPIILHHHERYDGSGYPSGLKGEQIPMGARIMAIVEAFEAMITKRPWRKALSVSQAISEIKRNSGTQFDPLVVEAFLKVIKNKRIRKKIKIRKS